MLSLENVLVNFSTSYNGIMRLLMSFMTVMGMGLTLNALYKLKVYGEIRTMMGGNTDLKGPLMMLMAAAVFLFFPTALSTFLETVYGQSQLSPLSYVTNDSQTFRLGMKAVFGLVQIIGVISFMRGWMMMVQSTQAHRGGAGKGITHIIAGIFAINIVATKEVISNTFGL